MEPRIPAVASGLSGLLQTEGIEQVLTAASLDGLIESGLQVEQP
jgi:hypothetical protein